MTPQQAREIFDNIIDFKERFLYWENNKSLIQQSFIDLWNELKELVGKTDQESNWRKGNIFRELEALAPIPQTNEEKAFMVKCEVERIRNNLDNPFPILTFEEFKAEFWKVIENSPKKEHINSELDDHEVHLRDKKFYCEKTILIKGQKKQLDYYIKNKLNNDYEIDLSLFYESIFYNGVNSDWNGIAFSLAYILSPIQYVRFLEGEKAKLASIATNQQEISKSSNVSISTNSTPKGFNLVGYSIEQLTSLHKALIDKKYLKDNAPLKHFINAFNGKELEDFEPLKWKSKTMGAIFIHYFLRKSETHWKDTQHILEPANYKQLLSQILKNNKFQDCTNELNIIEKQIKLLTIIDSQ